MGVLLLQGAIFWGCALAGGLAWVLGLQGIRPGVVPGWLFPVFNGVLLALAAGASVALARRVLRWPWEALGGLGWTPVRQGLWGMGVAALAWVDITVLLALGGSLAFSPQRVNPAVWGAVALALLLGAWGEELVFRGLWFSVLRGRWPFPLAALGSTLVFSLLHMANPGWTWRAGVGVFLAGWLLALAREDTGSLAWPVGFHWAWNLVQGPVLGFTVSGLPLPSLWTAHLDGPAWWTGDAFGPEAGLAAWLVLLAVILLSRHAGSRKFLYAVEVES